MSCFKAASVFWGNNGFSFIYGTTYWRIWRDGQASLKGMLNMCTYFVLIEYFLSLKGIYTITFEQTYSSAKLFQGGKKDFVLPKFQWGYCFFKQNVGASMCTVSFTKEWILWSHSHYMMHECKPQYWNKPNNFVLQKWYLFRQIVVGWENEMETEFQKLIHCIVPQTTFFAWMFLLIQQNILLQGKSIYILYISIVEEI